MVKLKIIWILYFFLNIFLFSSLFKGTPIQYYQEKIFLAYKDEGNGEKPIHILQSEGNIRFILIQGNGVNKVSKPKKLSNPHKERIRFDIYMYTFGMALFFWSLSIYFAPYIEREKESIIIGNLRKVEYNVESGSRFLSWIFRKVAWFFTFFGFIYLAIDFKEISGALIFIFLIKRFLYKYKPKLAILAIFLILFVTGAYIWETKFTFPEKRMETPSKQHSINPSQKVGDDGKYSLTILAAHDKLSPIRITVDEDVRRPYWVEHGESIQIKWNKKVTIEGELTVTVLWLNGIAYSLSGNQSKISLTNNLADKFLKSTSDI